MNDLGGLGEGHSIILANIVKLMFDTIAVGKYLVGIEYSYTGE